MTKLSTSSWQRLLRKIADVVAVAPVHLLAGASGPPTHAATSSSRALRTLVYRAHEVGSEHPPVNLGGKRRERGNKQVELRNKRLTLKQARRTTIAT
ncbi:hypothetical protein PF005_g11776 [Phytophthora fragariae]|uniref:Uncharacterized protein n=1 Tax=Phytophthora fragariae TaxID=53985 RepID=A0A6A3S5R7_9STRA|nr:hypothetical protein PF003_g26519 [Phytophthora fragariae]KAE8937117.1 hypothetical protein PF009_g12971 [Phytophthora fragariae]KAE9109987.1 hypothetical protein PF007_g12038 [Phytophthora fragariae]KAE9147156.1 hypothetical protein PF006_g8148 [Phytophthora fragariae]KAE9209589.1 hypothetical protein PF005_g11776 [Phytophthora fragariae]